jgi:glycosyltransferase involved in cell wall biosynthesis
LYLQPAAAFGGAERQAAQTLALLPKFDIEPLALVGPGAQIVEFLADAGVDQFVWTGDFPDDPPSPSSARERARRVASYVRRHFGALDVIRREARRFRAEVVFASRPFAWVAGTMAAHRLGIPSVWRAGTSFNHPVETVLLGPFARQWRPAALVCNSRAVLRGIAPEVPAPAFLIPNGVDTDRFRAGRPLPSLRRELGIPDGAPVVAFVARLAPEKGLGLLVEVTARLAATVPGVRLLVAGDSAWRAPLEAAFARPRVAGVVRILGYVREVERVYDAADVVISTSTSEWCSNTLLEAMAMGRAVVATAVGGTREIVHDGEDGVLVPPGSARAFAASVAALLADERTRARLGAAAVARMRSDWSMQRQVARIADVIRWAATRSMAPAPRFVAPPAPESPTGDDPAGSSSASG